MSDRWLTVGSWKKLSLQVRLGLLAGLSGCIANGFLAVPVGAQGGERSVVIGHSSLGEDELQITNDQEQTTNDSILQLSELEQPATTIDEWVAQIEAALVQITGVRVEATESGLQVILETENGVLEVPETRSIGNALIADISNAAIAEEFSQAEPIEGIALVNVTSLPGDRVRVAITGTEAPPVAEVTAEAQGLVLAVTLGDAGTTAEEDAIQVVVTGEQDEGYNPSNATTATRTDTPLRDIPASITVVPRQVLDDRNVRDLNEALETVAGVGQVPDFFGAPSGTRVIRGFTDFGAGNFRNGFRDVDYFGLTPVGTIEQVEVLRGPASVLFGNVEPGGIINVVTRQPLSEPYYNLAFEAGNYDFYQPSIDLSGPLTEDDTLLYRFIASYQSSESYQDFVDTELITIAPSITLNLGERTRLNLYYEYVDFLGNPPEQRVALLSDGSFTPRSLYPGYPDLFRIDVTTQRFGYTLNHEFNDNWQIRNNIAISLSDFKDNRSAPANVIDDRFLTDFRVDDLDYTNNNYFGQIDLIGQFNPYRVNSSPLCGVKCRDERVHPQKT
jgi:iron complex outermembrane recepter protein